MDIKTIKRYISTHSWMFHTIDYNFKQKNSISSTHDTLGPKRQGDRSIMELVDAFYPKTTEEEHQQSKNDVYSYTPK